LDQFGKFDHPAARAVYRSMAVVPARRCRRRRARAGGKGRGALAKAAASGGGSVSRQISLEFR